MENIVIDAKIIQDTIAVEVPKQIASFLEDSYSSPIKKVIEKAVEANLDSVKALVNEVIASAITDPTFKAKLGEAVLSQIVSRSLGGR